MRKKKLLVTRHFPEDVLVRARRDYDCNLNEEDVVWPYEELLNRAKGMDAILCSSSNEFTSETFSALPKSIKIIATFSAGHEHINLAAAKSAGIIITNTPDAVTNSTADIAIFLLLASARRAREAQELVTEGKWTGWTPTQLLGIEPRGRRLGILGMGRIGQAVAQKAKAFGLLIHYHNRKRLHAEKEDGAIFHETIEELLKVSDFLSIHCQLTPETKKIINHQTIKYLPEKAVIINTSRGGVIDDDSLIQAIKSGKVVAAGLDVFDHEPSINKNYLPLKNVFLLPHIGSATTDCRNAMGFQALDNIDAFFRGESPKDRLV